MTAIEVRRTPEAIAQARAARDVEKLLFRIDRAADEGHSSVSLFLANTHRVFIDWDDCGTYRFEVHGHRSVKLEFEQFEHHVFEVVYPIRLERARRELALR
ncbi:hypothetical protein C6369_021275 [Rhodococcus rhodochrous]|uniref:hypothetical protein n=1 Tax=Rhodococcus rhodochrous TaxID=1829 RepID=UPI000D06C745|nr:hypothetical protein [Rhodococcus rhodochrous]AYA26719.1 hypothetical protein C6369_021275 [Rhodococcus rhodochrous]